MTQAFVIIAMAAVLIAVPLTLLGVAVFMVMREID